MALIVRIVSADGKKVVSKVLPAVPSRIKVPEGARVEVIDKDTGVRQSLGRYVNDRTRHDDKDEPHRDQNAENVQLETVATWAEAEAWLTHMDRDLGYDVTTADWFAAGAESKGGAVLGLDKTPLAIGGGLGAIAAVGAAVASGGGGGPKDTIAPVAPSGLALAAGDDTGRSATDGITSKKSVILNGTAEAGSKVELLDGATSLGTVTAGADGKFTKTLDLTEGVHAITARATDNAGNQSAPSTLFRIVVDETVPVAPAAPDLAAADDTGTSNSDNITRNTTGLTFTGTIDAGASIELFDGTTSLGKATADTTTGAYTIDVTLAEGTHVITATATDAAGNASVASSATTVIVDRTVPLAPARLDLDAADDDGTSSTDNITSVTSGLTLSTIAEPNAIVQILQGTTVLATNTAGTNGLVTFELNQSVGTLSLTARTTDLAGNQSPSSEAVTIQIVAAPQGIEISNSSADLLLAGLDSGAHGTDPGDTGGGAFG